MLLIDDDALGEVGRHVLQALLESLPRIAAILAADHLGLGAGLAAPPRIRLPVRHRREEDLVVRRMHRERNRVLLAEVHRQGRPGLAPVFGHEQRAAAALTLAHVVAAGRDSDRARVVRVDEDAVDV